METFIFEKTMRHLQHHFILGLFSFQEEGILTLCERHRLVLVRHVET